MTGFLLDGSVLEMVEILREESLTIALLRHEDLEETSVEDDGALET